MGSKIYVLVKNDYCEYITVTATTDQEKAKKLAETLGCYIEEYVDGGYDPVLSGHSFFDVRLDEHGLATSVSKLTGFDHSLRSSLKGSQPKAPYYFCVLAKDLVGATRNAEAQYREWLSKNGDSGAEYCKKLVE